MRYIKQYEQIEEPQIGDYVIIQPDVTFTRMKNEWCKVIGQIDNLFDMGDFNIYVIKIGQFAKEYIKKHEIVHFSKNKKDIENIITANKYNL